MRIALGIKNKNKNPKAISAIKKDRHTFGLIFGNKIDLSESFKYPITSIPLEDEWETISIPLTIGNFDDKLTKAAQ